MVMRSGDSWHCTNLSCNVVILVQTESQGEGVIPRCSCGAPMKKKYKSPVFRYLDFLRTDQPVLTSQSLREDGKE
jgi:hypothetical protein